MLIEKLSFVARSIILSLCVSLLLNSCGTSKSTATGGTAAVVKKSEQAKVVMDDNGDWTLVTPDGAMVAKVYTEKGSSLADRFHEGYIRIVSADGLKIGYANMKGQVAIQPCYLSASVFAGPIAAVTPYSDVTAAASTDDTAVGELTGNELWGVIDKNGMYVRTPSYRREWDSGKGYYVYINSVNRFYITYEGEMVDF